MQIVEEKRGGQNLRVVGKQYVAEVIVVGGLRKASSGDDHGTGLNGSIFAEYPAAAVR